MPAWGRSGAGHACVAWPSRLLEQAHAKSLVLDGSARPASRRRQAMAAGAVSLRTQPVSAKPVLYETAKPGQMRCNKSESSRQTMPRWVSKVRESTDIRPARYAYLTRMLNARHHAVGLHVSQSHCRFCKVAWMVACACLTRY